MQADHGAGINVVRFRRERARAPSRREQKNLMDTVYTAGILPVSAADRDTKAMAACLHLFGLVVIDSVEADGTIRRLRPSESMHASLACPWRVAKPSRAKRRTGAGMGGAACGAPLEAQAGR